MIASIISGKGGVGKSTVALNLAVALVNLGHSVTVVDANLKNPHLGINLGSLKLECHIHEVLKKERPIREAVYQHASGIRVVPGHPWHNPLHELDLSELRKMLLNLESDYVLLDLPPGFGKDVVDAIKASDKVIVVANPELSSITDALKSIKLAKSLNVDMLGIVLNRIRSDALEMHPNNVEAMLEARILGKIPEDDAVRASVQIKHPVVHSHPNSRAAEEFKGMASYIRRLT